MRSFFFHEFVVLLVSVVKETKTFTGVTILHGIFHWINRMLMIMDTI